LEGLSVLLRPSIVVCMTIDRFECLVSPKTAGGRMGLASLKPSYKPAALPEMLG
jgi:hypothetical protein